VSGAACVCVDDVVREALRGDGSVRSAVLGLIQLAHDTGHAKGYRMGLEEKYAGQPDVRDPWCEEFAGACLDGALEFVPGTVRDGCVGEVLAERERQDERWGVQNHGPEWFLAILMEEVGEFSREVLESRFRGEDRVERVREELVQVAAVALQMVECAARNGWGRKGASDVVA